MTWLYNGKVFTSEDIQDNLGFVYVITNLKTSRMYIGQKKFYKSKTFQKNGKRRRKMVESDWKDYYGSSQTLQEDVKAIGPELFYRNIIHLCKSKGEMNYLELREQVINDVLLNDLFYNDYVGSRIHRKHLGKARERLLPVT